MAYYKQVSKTFAPASGNTVTIPAFDDNVMCCFIDTSALAALTISLPAGAMDGQAIRVFTRSAITLLGFTFVGGTLVNAVTGLLGAGSSQVWAYKADTNEWWKG